MAEREERRARRGKREEASEERRARRGERGEASEENKVLRKTAELG